MTKNFCDRCGKEIKKHNFIRNRHNHFETLLSCEFEVYGITSKKYDLCYECMEELKSFMNLYKNDKEK